jgi:hypothetical protein
MAKYAGDIPIGRSQSLSPVKKGIINMQKKEKKKLKHLHKSNPYLFMDYSTAKREIKNILLQLPWEDQLWIFRDLKVSYTIDYDYNKSISDCNAKGKFKTLFTEKEIETSLKYMELAHAS